MPFFSAKGGRRELLEKCPSGNLQTEKAYLYWVRFFIRWHGRARDKLGSNFDYLPTPHHKGRAQRWPVWYFKPFCLRRGAQRPVGKRRTIV
ncbi:hypothetical protein FUT63_07010 [Extensimonas vulgaris]|nr:hypothetical protein FUT63_07010 [Extensimonas vulgaris]